MRIQSKQTLPFSVLSLGLLALSMSACGGPAQPAAPPPVVASAAPAPPPSAPPAATTPPPAPAPAPTAAAPAEPPHGGHHHHPMMGMLVADLDQVGIKPEQKPVIDGIKADLEKLPDSTKEARSQLAKDLADGAAAGKLDKAKIAADQKKLTQAAESSVAQVQEDANKLHKALDAAQRKKLVELMRAKGKEMGEHMKGEHGKPGDHDKGPAGKPGDKGDKGPAGKPGDKGDKGPAGKTGDKAPAGKPGDKPEAGKPGEKGEHEHGPAGKPGDHEKGEHGHMGPMGHEHARMEKLAEELGLSAEQKDKLMTKLEAVMKGEMAKMKEGHATMQKQMKAIADAFESEKFDAKKAGICAHAGEMLKKMTDGKIAFIEAVLSILTPEQRAKFAEHIRQHADDQL